MSTMAPAGGAGPRSAGRACGEPSDPAHRTRLRVIPLGSGLRVARLAAAGDTNLTIAQALFIVMRFPASRTPARGPAPCLGAAGPT